MKKWIIVFDVDNGYTFTSISIISNSINKKDKRTINVDGVEIEFCDDIIAIKETVY